MTSGQLRCPCRVRKRRWFAIRSSFEWAGIVYVALSRDEWSMGFGFPKDERAALVAAQPEKFFMPFRPTCVTSGSECGWTRLT
jgi:hypothetical protein